MDNKDSVLEQAEEVTETAEAEVTQVADATIEEAEETAEDVHADEVLAVPVVESSADETAESTEADEETGAVSEEPPDEPDPAVEEQEEQQEQEEVLSEVGEDMPTDEELFLAALNDDSDVGNEDFMLTTLRRGQIVTGIIASKTSTEILVDVGAKSEGIIGGRELELLDSEVRSTLEVGQEIDVYVLTPEDRKGHILLSLRRALEEQDWRDAETYLNDETLYTSKIAGYNKGGLIVRFGKVRGFVPSSQVSRDRRMRSNGSTPEERWSHMVGEEISVKVIEVDRGRNRLILSERAAMRELRAELRQQLFEKLEVGQVYDGRVTRLADFGAFVDIGGVDGLVHISELAWKPINHPKDAVKVGEEIEVEVIHLDLDRQRIGLSLKNRLPDPWATLTQEYAAGQLVQGMITKLTKFGAFARLVENPEIEGLIHISELAERRIGHPREVVQEDQVLTLRIIRIDPERRRMGLSLKRVDSEEYLDDDWYNIDEPAEDDNGEDVEEFEASEDE